MAANDAEEILNILDNAADDFAFPMGDNMAFYQGGVRMDVFADEGGWLVAVQELAYAIKDQRFVRTVFGYGAAIEDGYAVVEQVAFRQHDDDPFFEEVDGQTRFILNPLRFSIAISGGEKSFALTKEDYAFARIEVDDPQMPNEAKIIRLLATLDGDMLLDAHGLAAALAQERLPKHFMTLTRWQQPDLAEDELPSSVACFRSLATAIARRDPEAYRCDPKCCNTHWSHWEWYRDRGNT